MTFGEAWNIAQDIEGWFNAAEGELLWQAAEVCARRPYPFLEIGSHCGRSSSLLLRHQTTVLIDSSFLWGGNWEADIEKHAKLGENLRGLPYILIQAPSQKVMIGTPRFGLVFIDGDHNKGGVDLDCEKYLPLLVSGGLAVWHDYNAVNFPHVVEAVDRYTEGWKKFGRVDSLIVKVKP